MIFKHYHTDISDTLKGQIMELHDPVFQKQRPSETDLSILMQSPYLYPHVVVQAILDHRIAEYDPLPDFEDVILVVRLLRVITDHNGLARSSVKPHIRGYLGLKIHKQNVHLMDFIRECIQRLHNSVLYRDLTIQFEFQFFYLALQLSLLLYNRRWHHLWNILFVRSGNAHERRCARVELLHDLPRKLLVIWNLFLLLLLLMLGSLRRLSLC